MNTDLKLKVTKNTAILANILLVSENESRYKKTPITRK